MALSTATGVVSVTTGAIGTTFVVSGLSFQPKAIVFVWNMRNATGIAEADHSAGVGIATSTSSRRAYAFQVDHALNTNANRDQVWRNDCVATTITTAAGVGGHLDISAIASDGFTLIIDDVFPAAMVVGWIAYGGSDITDVAIVDWTLRTTTGDTDVPTGFALNTGADDKAVIAIGIRASDAAGTIASDASLSVAIAAGDTIQQANIAIIGDDAADPSNTARYGRAGDFICSINTDDTVYARESLTTWLADGFRVNTVETPGFALRRSALVIKGGRWQVGDFVTSTGTSNTDEATTYAPNSIFAISHCETASTSDTPQAVAEFSIGAATSDTSRWAFWCRDNDASATSDAGHAYTNAQFYYNGAASTATEDGTCDLVDFVPASGNGFTWVMDNADASAYFVAYLISASSSQSAAAGLVEETDSALAVTRTKVKAVGLVDETDSVLTATLNKRVTVGLVEETDTLFTVAGTKAKTVGLVEETDTALQLVMGTTVVVGLVEETDTPFAVTTAKALAAGLVEETDSSLAVNRLKATAVGLVEATDTSLAVGRSKSLAVGLVSETGLAQAVGKAKAKLVGLVEEIDGVFAVGHSKLKAVGLTVSTDVALAVAAVRSVVVGLVTEVSSVFSVGRAKSRTVGLVQETDTSLGVTSNQQGATGGQRKWGLGLGLRFWS